MPLGHEPLAVLIADACDIGEVPLAFKIYGSQTCELEVAFKASGRMQLTCSAGAPERTVCPVLLLEVNDGVLRRH